MNPLHLSESLIRHTLLSLPPSVTHLIYTASSIVAAAVIAGDRVLTTLVAVLSTVWQAMHYQDTLGKSLMLVLLSLLSGQCLFPLY